MAPPCTAAVRTSPSCISPASNDAGAGYLNFNAEDRRILLRGEAIYKELCFSCHGSDGRGAPMAGAPAGTTMAPPLAGSPRVVGHRDYVVRVLLHGLTGPIEGKEYNGGAVMVPMGTNTDQWIADAANYVRTAFGNGARPFVTVDHVAAVRKTGTRRTPWTVAELSAIVPALLTDAAAWKATASHNPDAAPNAIGLGTGPRWDSGGPQQQGMWFQIELPAATTLAEVQIDAASPIRGNGGLAGFGGLGVTPPAPATSARPSSSNSANLARSAPPHGCRS
jgi:mono/diheme cytochrome c family protein